MKKPLISKNPLFRLWAGFFYYCFALPILALYDKLVFGLRVRGREHLREVRGGGAILVCNHINYLDCTFMGLAAYPRKPVFTALERLFHVPVIAQLISWLGCVPVPASIRDLRSFLTQLGEALMEGRMVCVYPEGELITYCPELRKFKQGAFALSVHTGAPVVPMVILQEKRRGVWRLLKRKPCLTLQVGEPVYPPENPGPHAYKDLSRQVELRMAELLCVQAPADCYPVVKVADRF